MEHVLDVRGLNCPIPALRARRELDGLAPAVALVVLATDPEAPIDIAALAADGGRALHAEREAAHWRLTLAPAPAPPHARGGAGRGGGGPPT